MKKVLIPYWIFTGLLAAFMGIGAIPDIMSSGDAVELFKHLGYPDYLLPFLGIAKLLGVAAILVPVFPRIKEWAYAGLFFDLSGATFSTIAVDGLASGLIFLIGYIMIAGSYYYYHRRSKSGLSSETQRVNKANGELQGY
ncbi:DoxX-like family protein [Paenibacillus sp. UNC496MF]|uniref:DoxX family protein n=1 Tax=Paenibacillus sp. UNC496MF TaxID=1502753 RepID=UPI0008E9D9F7|nr:DoxX family protein [Paenibacillus sp. UNC496MF]SFJ45240.1 DoxX-like family protein [Paenibacillus sp. UNC496MF]